MAYPIGKLWLAAALIVPLAACSPASPPSDPTPPPMVPPTTPASASVATTVALQAETPVLPVQVQEPEREASCLEALGETASKRLVVRCRAVSPATRPPCHNANPCWMIENEIKRSCDFFGPDEKPAECEA